MKGKFQQEIEQTRQRMHELGDLIKDTNHPEFIKRVSERNSLSVQLEVLKQKNTGVWQPDYANPTYTIILNKQQ